VGKLLTWHANKNLETQNLTHSNLHFAHKLIAAQISGTHLETTGVGQHAAHTDQLAN